MCLASLGDMVVPYFIGSIIDAMAMGQEERIQTLIKVWIIFLAFGSLCTFLNKIIFGYTCELIGTRIRKDLFEKVISKDVTFFDKVKTGDISK
jgi:ABC-type multidrug transport system fused ATPase/permease subunit